MNALVSFTLLTAFVIFLGACDPSAGPGPDPSPDPSQPGTTLTVQGTAPGALARSGASRSLRPVSRAAGDPVAIPLIDGDGTTLGAINLTKAKVVVKDFEFEQEGAGGDGEVEFSGPYIVDLIAGTMDPPPPTVDLAAGTYDEITFKIDAPEEGDADENGDELIVADPTAADPNADMLGYSILLEGDFTPTGGLAVPFTFGYNKDEIEFKLKDSTSTGFIVDPASVNDIVIAFRLVRWFEGLDAVALAADPAGYLAANEELFKESIQLSADYGKDDDHDGTLESDEDDDPADSGTEEDD